MEACHGDGNPANSGRRARSVVMEMRIVFVVGIGLAALIIIVAAVYLFARRRDDDSLPPRFP